MNSSELKKLLLSSFRRKSLDVLGTLSSPKGPESRNRRDFWTPGFTGVTALMNYYVAIRRNPNV
jgi:hypothetical protein